MTESSSTYAVGRGKPPLHTRFHKGQSGNPSGKPGPTKLAKQRFERALYAALESSEAELEQSKPDNIITAIARRIALDAVAGRIPAIRLVLSLLEAQSGNSAGAGDDAAEHLFTGAELFSLLQGKKLGNGKTLLEEFLSAEEGTEEAQAEGNAWEERRSEPAPARNEAEPHSLLQGKTQGCEKQWLEDILWPDAHEEPALIARERKEAEPLSLMQGKTQGNAKKLKEQISPAIHPAVTPAAARARLMAGATPVTRAAGFPVMRKGTAGKSGVGYCHIPLKPEAVMAAACRS